MKSISPAAAKVVERFSWGKDAGILLAETTGHGFPAGRAMEINGKLLTSYASCSYLGLDQDPRLREAAKDAIDRYGTYFSSSRTYLQQGQYTELEDKLTEVFGAPTLVAASTTLAHLSLMPIVIGNRDAIIVDYQAHNSLQDAVTMMKGRGAHREIVPHNDMTALRERIVKLSASFAEVWYVLDGVYSIYGDEAPLAEIEALLEEFPKLRLYVDDAHGMGWTGRHGRGLALSRMRLHERMVLVTSLNKAAASGGGAIVLPTEELRDYVRVAGKTLIFSGPLPPSAIAAATAFADICLSPEIDELQDRLKRRCRRFLEGAEAYDLNIVDDSPTPVFYVGMGDYPIMIDVAVRLRERHGVFVNPTGYPAVPFSKCGFRITVTAAHSDDDIRRLTAGLAEEFATVLALRGVDRESIRERFAGGVAAAVAS